MLRTRPADDISATGRARAWKNRGRGAIFNIHEALLSILHPGANGDAVRKILGAVCNLPAEMQAEVKRALDAV